MMRKIILTGATGFIGRYMCKYLMEHDWEIYAVIRPNSPNKSLLLQGENMHIIEADIENIQKIKKEISQADVFFHLAWGGVNRGEIDDEAIHMNNAQYSLQCVETAIQLGCKVFMDAGSRTEYGIVNGMMSEDLECHPVTAYGKAKLLFYEKASKMLQEKNISFYHLRIFSVYGCEDHPWSIISTLTRELALGNKVSLSACLHQWNFMYIEDAVEAMYGLMERGLKHQEQLIVNIASNDNRPLYEFVHEIHQCTGAKSILEFGSFQQGKEGAVSIIADNNRMLQLLENYREKHSFCEGIHIILKYNAGKMEQKGTENK